MSDVCQSYVHARAICRDGFLQSSSCRGEKCHCCGTYRAEKKPPACCQEEQSDPRWFDDTGMPKFAEYRRGAP